jgi:hypothetical protein
MIHVPSPIHEPARFDAECRQRGQAWLATHATGRPYDYWSPFRDELALGFSWRCGYKAMLNLEATVDHFISCEEDRAQAYEWNNYRYVSQGVNSSKQATENLLDPFEVQAGWFRLLLPSLQLVLTDLVPADVRARADQTITRLKLVDGANVITRRKFWYNRVAQHGLPLPHLEQYAPLVAQAIQEWLNQYHPPLPVLP